MVSAPTGALKSTAAKVAVVVAVVAVGGVAAAQMGMLDGVVGSDSSGTLDQVPDGVDSVATFDASVFEDDVTNRLYVAAYNETLDVYDADGASAEDGGRDADEGERERTRESTPSEMLPANVTAALDRAENESGLDPRAVDEVAVFQQRRENLTEPRYAGAIVHADWSESAFVGAITNNTGRSYENTTVEGVTVYKPADSGEGEDDERFGPPQPEEWIAVLDDGEYAVGTARAVNDTIQVAVGNAEPVDGDLRSAYERTRDGYFRYAQRSQNVNVTRVNETVGSTTGLNVTAYARAYNDLYVTSGSYYLTDDGLGVESHTLTNSTDTARDVEDLTQGFLSIQAGAIQNETIENELRSTEVTRDGTTVTVTRETSVDVAIKLIRWYGSILEDERSGAGAQPIA
ncbi:MAG: hypothetical protein ABEJ26_02325 [Halosimplex sp.]